MSTMSQRRWQVGGHEARALRRPDDWWALRLPEGRQSWPALVAARPPEVRRLLVTARSRTTEDEAALRAAGFSPGRTEQLWRVPLAGPASLQRADRILDRGHPGATHRLRPVTECDLERVTALDNDIRGVIPGTAGWVGTVEDLAETLEDEEFNPELYLVAEHRESGSYDGLVRIWFRRPVPRLGCLGVTAPWRRTRLASHLLVEVARRLRARGIEEVVTDTATSNRSAYLLARNHGAIPLERVVEWVLEP